MAREKKVIDASIIVKWFAEEEGSREALQLRKEHAAGSTLLIIPELALIEVINALRYKGGTLRSLDEASRALWDTQFHIEKVNAFLLNKSSELALRYNLTVYDALYVALGLLHGCPIYTADNTLGKVPSVIILNR